MPAIRSQTRFLVPPRVNEANIVDDVRGPT
jgi:hypothetical protein